MEIRNGDTTFLIIVLKSLGIRREISLEREAGSGEKISFTQDEPRRFHDGNVFYVIMIKHNR